MRITTVGLDADDTLWHNETFFRLSQDRFRGLMADVAAPEVLDERLAAVERRNLALYGYGVKGFTLSLIETAMELTGGEPSGRVIADILACGREMLAHPVEPLPGVEHALAELSDGYRLVLITKGDLLHQEQKLAASGLGELFAAVEIVSDEARVRPGSALRGARPSSGGSAVRPGHAARTRDSGTRLSDARELAPMSSAESVRVAWQTSTMYIFTGSESSTD